ncbi:MAG: hypothetical protein K8R89_07055 [Anaerolineae bacterium]|nr:hypothetical protein [Anaerolineae bacterium]
MNPQALNRYAYCLNNPLRYVDPTGHESGPEILWVFTTPPDNLQRYIDLLAIRKTESELYAWVFGVPGFILTAAAVGTGGTIVPLDIGALTCDAIAGGFAYISIELDSVMNYLQLAVDSGDASIRVTVYKEDGMICVYTNGAQKVVALLPAAASEFYTVFRDPEKISYSYSPDKVMWEVDHSWGWLYSQ